MAPQQYQAAQQPVQYQAAQQPVQYAAAPQQQQPQHYAPAAQPTYAQPQQQGARLATLRLSGFACLALFAAASVWQLLTPMAASDARGSF